MLIESIGIRAIPNSMTNNSTANGLNSAILNYEGVDVVDPSSEDSASKNPLVETNLHPFDPSPVVREICTPMLLSLLMGTGSSLTPMKSST